MVAGYEQAFREPVATSLRCWQLHAYDANGRSADTTEALHAQLCYDAPVSSMTLAIRQLRDDPSMWPAVLRLNNDNARETSPLTLERLGGMIASASVATAVVPGVAFLLAFGEGDDFDGGHFRWFRERLDTFLYIDRVVVGSGHRRLGIGRMLYEDLIRRAERLGHAGIACEVNMRPPNPTSDAFHAAFGFSEIGTATIEGGARTVRYLVRRR